MVGIPSNECSAPSWKIHLATPNAAAVASRLVSTPTAARSGCLQRDQQQQEPESEHDPDHERRLGGEGGLEVVVLGDGAADQRSGWELRAEAVDRGADGRVGGILLGDRGHERVAVARLGWQQRAIAGSRRATCATWAACAAGATICIGPVAPGPIAACTCW